MSKLKICLETSSYLPLIWITPYTQGIVNLIQYYRDSADFYIQEDCLIEALSYIHYPQNWFRHAPVRLRKLAQILTDEHLEKLSFPSSAFQILLGGKMWAQGLYLNFVRHTTFLYADLVDQVNFALGKREGLLKLAELVDERFDMLTFLIESHRNSSNFEIDFQRALPYWGRFYLFLELPNSLDVKVWKDAAPFEKGIARIRDVFHYESMLNSEIGFHKMIVANTGFAGHIKKTIKKLPIEILCAQSRQVELFA